MGIITSVAEPFEPLLELLYAAFRDEHIAVFFAVSLLAAALFVYLFFRLVRIQPFYSTLRRLNRAVTAHPDTLSFCENFQIVDEAFKREHRFSHVWSEFGETLVLPEADEPKVIRNTARPASYLNLHAAIESGLPLPGYQAMPNYFVGIGLLFTFLGLVAGLHYAAEGVNSPNVKDAQKALEILLKVASFKFLTSIAGILSSLFLSYFIKKDAHKLQVLFEVLCKSLESRLSFVTAESIALAQLRQQRAQTLQLERFNTDFAIQIAEALEAKLSATLGSALSTALAPLTDRLEGMTTSIGSANEDTLKKMLADFSGNLQQSTGKEIELLAGELKNINATIAATSNGVTQSGSDFGLRLEAAASKLENILTSSGSSMREGLGNAVTRLQQVLSDGAEQIKQNSLQSSSQAGDTIEKAGGSLAKQVNTAASQLETSLAPTVQALEGIERVLLGLHGRLELQTNEFNGSVSGMRSLVQQIDTSAGKLREAALPVAATAESLGRASNQNEIASRAAAETHQRIAALVTNLDASIASNRKTWEEYRTRFENVDVALANTVKELLAGSERFQGQVAKFMTELDQHLGSSLNSLAGGVEQLSDAAEQIDETVGKFVKATTRG